MRSLIIIVLAFTGLSAAAGPSGGFRGDPVDFVPGQDQVNMGGDNTGDAGYFVVINKIKDMGPDLFEFLVFDVNTKQHFLLVLTSEQLRLLPDGKTWVTSKGLAGFEI